MKRLDKKLKELLKRIDKSPIVGSISGEHLILIDGKEDVYDDNEYTHLNRFLEYNIKVLLDLQKDIIYQLANDHYWDSLEQDKNIILSHIRGFINGEIEPKTIKIDEIEMKFNDFMGNPMDKLDDISKNIEGKTYIKNVKYWKKGMSTACPKCGKRIKPTAQGDYNCSNCFFYFQVRVNFNI